MLSGNRQQRCVYLVVGSVSTNKTEVSDNPGCSQVSQVSKEPEESFLTLEHFFSVGRGDT